MANITILKRTQLRIGKNAKKYRKLAGMTQEDMTDHGFDLRYYQDFEGGKNNVSIEYLVNVSRTLKIDVSQLLDPVKK